MQIAVQFAALRENCAGILVLFDADDDCPRELAPTLECWAREAAGGRPCAVVMAKREYEAWFLASIEGLRGRRGVLPDATSHPDPESPRDAKGKLERRHAARRELFRLRRPGCNDGASRPGERVPALPQLP
jgi:hypothetical protein